MVVQDLRLVGDQLRAAPRVPLVGVLGDDAQHALLAAAADQDRQRVLHRLRFADRVGELVVLAVEGGRGLAQQAVQDLQGLDETVQQPLHRGQLDAVLLVLVDLPAGADAEGEAAAGDLVDGGRHVGQHGRVPVGVAVDQRADAYTGHHRAERGDQRAALQGRQVRRPAGARVGHEVVGDVDAVPAGRRRVPGHVEHLAVGLPGAGPDRESHTRQDARDRRRAESRCDTSRDRRRSPAGDGVPRALHRALPGQGRPVGHRDEVARPAQVCGHHGEPAAGALPQLPTSRAARSAC